MRNSNRAGVLPAAMACISALSACTSAEQKADPSAARIERTRGCIEANDLSEWEPLNDHSILLSMPGTSRAYLLELAVPIADLGSAGDIEVVDGNLDGRICADGHDGILAEECNCAATLVASIEYLSEKRTAELLADSSSIL